jgi:hypothetical protein
VKSTFTELVISVLLVAAVMATTGFVAELIFGALE